MHKAGKFHNHCKEAINLFLQYNFFYLLNSKYSNLNGPGLSAQKEDQDMKGTIWNIYAKNHDNTIDGAAKSFGTVHKVCEVVEHENHAVSISPKPSFAKELDRWLMN